MRRKTWKDAAGHMSLWERFENHTGSIWYTQAIPTAVMKDVFFKYGWETPNKLPSARSISFTLRAYGHIFFRTAFYSSVEAFPRLLVQCGDHSLSCFLQFQVSRQKNATLHPQRVVKQILHQITENTNKRCSFQANRQKYPYLLPASKATEVRGRCLMQSKVAASYDDELQISLCKARRLMRQDTGQPGFL